MKVNAHSIKRSQRPLRDFELKCPNNPDLLPVLTLQRLGTLEIQGAYRLGLAYYGKHFTGTGPADANGKLDTKSKSYVEPVPLPAVDGMPVILSLDSCQTFAVVEAAQVAKDEDSRYRFDEIAAFATSDAMADTLLTAANWAHPRLADDLDDENPLA